VGVRAGGTDGSGSGNPAPDLERNRLLGSAALRVRARALRGRRPLRARAREGSFVHRRGFGPRGFVCRPPRVCALSDRSIAAADEFFDRPRGAGTREWGAELFICRHQVYLPAPALFLGVKPPQSYSFFDFSRAQMSNSTNFREGRPTRVRETPEPPRAKPQPPKTSSPIKFDSKGKAYSADVWVHDLYEAAYVRSPDEKDVPKQEDLQGVQSEMPGREALSKEGEGIEKRGGGAQSEGRQSEARLSERQIGDGGKSATNGRSKAPRKEKLVVGVKKPVDRWANPFSQLVGFEEEIVPPSSISKETVEVNSAAKRGFAEAASEDGVNGGRVGGEEITGGEGMGNGGRGGSADWEGGTRKGRRN
jgi:hypothetical protein